MLHLNDSSAFIKDRYEDFKKQLNNQDFIKFTKFRNNFQRFEFIYNLPVIQEYNIQISNCNKNLPEAKSLKEKGNSAFQTGDYRKALNLYTKSLLKSPLGKENQDLSIIRANRSAALYHLDSYQKALVDIEEALEQGYPKDLLYKLKDRKAKCLLALKQHELGVSALQETLTALDDAKIPLERRLKWQKDIQIMIALMIKNKAKDEEIQDSDAGEYKISYKKHPVYVSASDAIEIKSDKETGRFAEAKRNINVGEVFLCEEAHCSVLLESNSETHCFLCMRRTESGEPCDGCDRVKFCSVKCKTSALKSHHAVECKILDSLWKSGLSVTCFMALRIFSQKNPKYFMKMKQELLKDEKSSWASKQYLYSDYLTVNNLVTHEDKRKPDGLLQKTFVAVYLFKCLKEASYFKDIPKEEENEYFKLIGGLILKNLQLLQFNAHEIFELECPKVDLNMSKSKFVGAGLYPTLALFNHSCNPGIVRYFQGTRVIARAVRPIKKGELVAENYGPIFTEMSRDKRRKELMERYWFKCECKACNEDWPLLENMDTQSLRFRCENTTNCTNVIVIPTSTMDFMIQCTACGKNTNLLKGLKVLQDSDNLFRLAQELLKNGEAGKAEVKFTELLQLLDETLSPPFRDYHLCQQGLRTTFLTNGNIYRIYKL